MKRFTQVDAVAVLLDQESRIVGVNATGRYGRVQVEYMRSQGTPVVALAALGRGGEVIDGLPVFDTVADAVHDAGVNAAAVFTPPGGVADAVIECADAGLSFAVVAAEFVPTHDTMRAASHARQCGMWLIGPNTAGMATPGVGLIGGIAPEFCAPGKVGVIGRSGTLSINIVRLMTQAGFGQSTIIHMGGDMICGRNPHEWFELFHQDPQTEVIVSLGEIGGGKEYELAKQIAKSEKPVVTLIVGRNAPAGKRMGHAGALVEGERGTAAAKLAVLRDAGAIIATSPADVAVKLRGMLG